MRITVTRNIYERKQNESFLLVITGTNHVIQ